MVPRREGTVLQKWRPDDGGQYGNAAVSRRPPKGALYRSYLHTAAVRRTEYDVASNGDFLMLSVAEGDQAATQINLLMNWFEELKARVPTK
jgi:hypothetical protein